MTVMIIAVVTIQSSVPKKVIVSSSYIIISLSILFSSYVFFLLVKYHSLVESLLLWIIAWSNTTVVPPEIFVKRTGWKYINYCRQTRSVGIIYARLGYHSPINKGQCFYAYYPIVYVLESIWTVVTKYFRSCETIKRSFSLSKWWEH